MKRTSRAIGNELELGGQCVKGINSLSATIGVVATTEAMMTALIDALLKAQTEYQFAIDASLAATVPQKVHFDDAGKFIMVVRDNLKPTLGTRYSEAWNKVGFINRTLQVPLSLNLRASLLQAIAQFFDTVPTTEIPGVMTKTMATTLHTDLTTAMAACRDAKVVQRQLKETRDAAMAALRVRIQALRNELKPLLAADDPRWLEFGFGVPADVHVTSAPEGVKLTLEANGHVVASWEDTVNTDRFRVYKRVAGTDTEYVPVDTTTGTTFDLGTFASGAHLDVQVTAINAAGESVASEAVEIVVP